MKKTELMVCSLIMIMMFSNVPVGLSDAEPLPRRDITDVMKAGLQKLAPQPGQTTKTAEAPGEQITFNGGTKYYTDWSQNGEWITFDTLSSDLINEVLVIPAGGGVPRVISAEFDGSCFAPNFHPYTNFVTFTEEFESESISTVWDVSITDDATEVVMPDAGAGYWNRDGDLFFYGSASESQLVLYDMDLDEPVWVWPEPNMYFTAVFSPDDSHIIVSKNDDLGIAHLYRYDIDTGEVEQLTYGLAPQYVSDYSPDGAWILYSTLGDDRWEMWAMNTINGNTKVVFADGPVINMMGSFSPDGRKLCYIVGLDQVTFEVFVADFPYAPVLPDPEINVLNPDGGETFTAGSEMEIIWESAAVSELTIEYSVDGGSSYIPIKTIQIPEDQLGMTTRTFGWIIPEDLVSDYCLISIYSEDDSGIYGESSDYFTITSAVQEPFIEVLTPNGGEVWVPGTSHIIRWNSYGIESFVIAYTTDPSDENQLHVIAPNFPATSISADMVQRYEWTVPDTPSENCMVIVSNSEISISDVSDGFFTIAGSAEEPWIDVLAPEAGERWQVATKNDIVWESDGVSDVNIFYSPDSMANWELVVQNHTPIEIEAGVFKYQWTIPDTPSSTCYVHVESAGNSEIYDRSSNPFNIIPAGLQPEFQWAYQTDDAIMFSSPAIGPDGTIYIGSIDGYLYAVTPGGTLKWRRDVGTIWSSPAVAGDGTIYVTSRGDGQYGLYAFAANGTQKWYYPTDDPIFSTPAIASDGTIYFGSDYGYFHAVKSDGTAKIQPKNLGVTIISSPSIGLDGTIYLGDYDGMLYAFTPLGFQKWKKQLDGKVYVSSPALGADGRIYVGTSEGGADDMTGNFYALSENGEILWSTPLKTFITTSPAIGADGIIYVTSSGMDNQSISHGHLHAIKPDDGSILWDYYDTGSNMFSSPAVGADGTIYTGSNDWNMYAFNTDGSIKWSFPVTGTVTSAPTLSNTGMLYFAATDWNIYSIDTRTGEGLAESPWPKFHQGLSNDGRSSAGERSFISLQTPRAGITLLPGSQFTITWNAVNVNTVRILLTVDNGESWSLVADNISASAESYQWQIPGDISSEQCKIRVVNTDDNTVFGQNALPFTITSGSFVLLTSNFDGEQLQAATSVVVAWDYNDVEKVNLQYSTDGGTTWKNISQGVNAAAGSYTWLVPEDVSNNCKIRVADASNTATVSVSTGAFAIISSTFIQLTAPKINDQWTAGSKKEIQWDFNGITNVKIEFSQDDGATWSSVTASTSAGTGAYSWTVPDIKKEQCRIRITSLEDAGVFDLSDRFSIIKPELSIEHTPIASAQENQVITFTAQVTSTDTVKTVVLHFDQTGSRRFKEDESQKVMTTSDGSTYTVTIDAGVFTATGMEYYIRATDSAKRNITSPPDEGYYAIIAEIEDIKSTHTLAGGSAQSAYRMVSIPLNLTRSTVKTQLEGHFPQGENGVDWRLFRYPAGSDTPEEYVPDEDNNGFEAFEPGRAFWIISQNDYRLQAPAGTTVTTSEPYSITLKAGWNDIANPWMFDISWDDIENPSNADLSVLYEYDGSWSNPANPPTTLEPWKGYAVKNLMNHNVIIKLNPIPDGADKIASIENVSAAKTAMQDDEAIHWMLGVTAQAGKAIDSANFFGIRSGALDTWDASDHAEPPRIGEYVSLSFPHQDWEKYPAAYTVDMRPPGPAMTSWDIDASTNIEHEQVTITLEGTDQLPEGHDILVFDRDSGSQIPLNGNTLSFITGAGITERHFTVSVGSEKELDQRLAESLPEGFLAASCYPNPFNPSTTLQYQMSEQANVVITVYNVIGQQVRRFDLGIRSPGTHSFVFDATGLTSGIYLYTVDTGYAAKTDKMLFMK